jgi:hypothetical protein
MGEPTATTVCYTTCPLCTATCGLEITTREVVSIGLALWLCRVFRNEVCGLLIVNFTL